MEKIICIKRNKEVSNTPEEVVRQQWIEKIINDKNLNIKNLEVEKAIKVGRNTNVRMDIEIVDQQKRTDLIIETKRNEEKLDKNQLFSYAKLKLAKFGIITNGNKTESFHFDYKDGFKANKIKYDDILSLTNEISPIQLERVGNTELTNKLKKIHNDIWNKDGSDPLEAFDQVSQVLFLKFYFEKYEKEKLKEYSGILTRKYFDDIKNINISKVIDDAFEKTKNAYVKDMIFDKTAKIKISPESFLSVIEELQDINLDGDVKGVVYETFLGGTFRKELGQYFTPRYIVSTINKIIKPKITDKVIDPACGSGGFLIEYFKQASEKINEMSVSEKEKKSLLHTLSNDNIYGIDKDKRLARTARINMIMHGDGHSNIYRGNGLYNIGGIWEDKFDVLIANPPYGSTVKDDQLIEKLEISNKYKLILTEKFGEKFTYENNSIMNKIGGKIIDEYQILDKNVTSAKSELLFLIRSIRLLKPGGKLGIVISDNVLNTSTMKMYRKEIMDLANLDAVIKLPVETFSGAGAAVKTSLLFMTKKFEGDKEINKKIFIYDASMPELIKRDTNKILELLEIKLNEATEILDKKNYSPVKELHNKIELNSINNDTDYRWDVQYYLYDKKMNLPNHKIIQLKNILIPLGNNKKVKKSVVIQNGWRLINKITKGGELFLHEFDKILDIKSKDFYYIDEETFIFSKMGAQNGCVYWNGKGSDGFVVTSEYPSFKMDVDLLDTEFRGKYIELVLRSLKVKKIISSETTGSGRERIDVDSFLNLYIPALTLSEQDLVIKKFDNYIKSKTNTIEKEIEMINFIDGFFNKHQ